MNSYFLLVLLGAASRLIPHPMNFSPVAAMGLFCGARGSGRAGWLVPVLSLLLADLIIGGYEPVSTLFVYLGFACSGLIGRWLLRASSAMPRVAMASLCASALFFLLSNFGCWLAGMYAPTPAGLLECYLRAIPFLGMTVLGDLVYSVAFFSLHRRAQSAAESLALA
jgi:hypothetical protein